MRRIRQCASIAFWGAVNSPFHLRGSHVPLLRTVGGCSGADARGAKFLTHVSACRYASTMSPPLLHSDVRAEIKRILMAKEFDDSGLRVYSSPEDWQLVLATKDVWAVDEKMEKDLEVPILQMERDLHFWSTNLMSTALANATQKIPPPPLNGAACVDTMIRHMKKIHTIVTKSLRNNMYAYCETILENIRNSDSFWWHHLFPKDQVPAWAAKVMMRGDITEYARAIKINGLVMTSFVEELRGAIVCSENRTVVVTGESGSGKSVSTVAAAATIEDGFVSYLTSNCFDQDVIENRLQMALCDGSVPNGTAAENEEREKNAIDVILADTIISACVRNANGLLHIPEDIKTIPNSTLTIIVDELGSKRWILRPMCRMMKETSNTYSMLKQFAEKTFGLTKVRLVAVGTGCDDVHAPCGSAPDLYTVLRSTPSSSGSVIFERLASNCRDQINNSTDKRCLFNCLVAVCGAQNIVCKDPDAVLHLSRRVVAGGDESLSVPYAELMRMPGVRGLSRRVCDLTGNARMASLIVNNLFLIANELPRGYRIFDQVEMMVGSAVNRLEGVVAHCVEKFVFLNGLGSVFANTAARFDAVAQCVALMMNGSDADLPAGMFNLLAVRGGLLTDHAEVRFGDDVPHGFRGIRKLNVSSFASTATSEPRQLVAPGQSKRYLVSPALVSMYLSGFGARDRSTSGSDFERLIMDFLMVAVPAAAHIVSWDQSKDAVVKGLAKPTKGLRGDIFEFLVGCYERGVNRGTAGDVRVNTIHPRAATKKYELLEKDGVRQLISLMELWGSLVEGAPTEGSVAIVQNAPLACGPDLLVLAWGLFALMIQLKMHQGTPLCVSDTLGEFVKMGAPAFDRAIVEKVIGADKLCEKQWAENRYIFNENRHNAFEASFKKADADFPSRHFLIIRCHCDASGKAKAQLQAILKAHANTHSFCKYIEMNPNDMSTYPIFIPKILDEKERSMDFKLERHMC